MENKTELPVSQGDVELEIENPETITIPENIDLNQPVTLESNVPIPPEAIQEIPSDVDITLEAPTTPQPTSPPQDINAFLDSLPEDAFIQEGLDFINNMSGDLVNPPQENKEEGGGFLDTVGKYGYDMLKGLNNAPVQLANSVTDLSWTLGNLVWTGQLQSPKEGQNQLKLALPTPTDTFAGKLVEDIGEFALGFGAVGTTLKGVSLVSKASPFARGTVQGAVADAIIVDAQEERLSNLIEDVPALKNPVTAYLAADKDDTYLEGKIKGVLEGMALGGVAEGLVAGLRGLRKAYGKPVSNAVIDVEAKPVAETPPTPQASTMPPQKAHPKQVLISPEALQELYLKGGKVKEVNDVVKSARKAGATEGISVQEAKAFYKANRNKSPKEFQKAFDALVKGTKVREVPSSVVPAKEMLDIVKSSAKEKTAFTEVMEGINLGRMTTKSPQGSHVLKQLSEAHADETLKSAGKESFEKVSQDVANDLADYGVDMRGTLEQAKGDNEALHAITRRMLIRRNFLSAMTDEVIHLADKIGNKQASALDMKRFMESSEYLQQMQHLEANTRTEIGRGLSSRRIQADGKVITENLGEGDEFFDRMFNSDMTEAEAAEWLGGRGNNQAHIDAVAADVRALRDDPKNVAKLMKQKAQSPSSLWGMAIEMRINALLSGATTHFTNVVSTSLKTVSLPLERILGGTISNWNDPKAMLRSWRQGTNMYIGMGKFMGDAFSMAGKALKSGKNILDTDHGINEISQTQFSYERIKAMLLKNNPEGTLNPLQEKFASGLAYIGKLINIPSRLLLTSDEFFKQLNFRSDLYSRMYDEAVDKMGFTENEEIAAYISQKMDEAFTADGAVARGELTADSLLKSQEATWTQSLAPGTLGAWLQQGSYNHAWMRVVMPFIRTPVNILNDFGRHTILAPWFSKHFKNAMKQGGEARADALGKVAFGSMTALAAIYYAQQGILTGSPPQDHKLRQQLEATGWQPYSIKVGDTYVSYRRQDPVGMFLGIAADACNIFEHSDDITKTDLDELWLLVAASATNNLMSKTYMTGIIDAVNALSEPERYFERLAHSTIISFMPYNSALRYSRKNQDPIMRETFEFTEKLMNVIPGLSNNLPARHNWVTGQIEEYNTLTNRKEGDYVSLLPDTRTIKTNRVLEELVNLGRGITGPPPKKFKNAIDLTAEQYSRLCELHGTLKLGNRTMMEQFAHAMASRDYDIDRKYRPDAADDMTQTPRSVIIGKIIEYYRERAHSILLQEFPELKKDYLLHRKKQELSKSGKLNKDNQADVMEELNNQMQQLQ